MNKRLMMLAVPLVLASLGAPQYAAAASNSAVNPTGQVTLTAQEAQQVSDAMEISASQCATIPKACVVGAFRPQILAKLNAAFTAQARKAPKK